MSRLWNVSVAGLLFVILSGCSLRQSAGELGRISPGSSKSDVLSALGTPSFASGKERVETLYYDLVTADGTTDRFFVRIISGTVDSYGKLEDTDAEGQPCAPENKKK